MRASDPTISKGKIDDEPREMVIGGYVEPGVEWQHSSVTENYTQFYWQESFSVFSIWGGGASFSIREQRLYTILAFGSLCSAMVDLDVQLGSGVTDQDLPTDTSTGTNGHPCLGSRDEEPGDLWIYAFFILDVCYI